MSTFSYDFSSGGAVPAGTASGITPNAAAAAMPPPAAAASSDAFDPAGLPAQLDQFWDKQMKDIVHLCETNKGFKNHRDLPLARIKRIMKSDEDVRMIRAEAPVLFAKACELFILELTLRSSTLGEDRAPQPPEERHHGGRWPTRISLTFCHDVLTQNDDVAGGGGAPPSK